MARRANPAAGPTASEEHEEKTPMAGGAPGIPTEAASSAAPPIQREPDPAATPPPVPKRYVVLQERRIAMGGMIVRMPTGKVLDDSNYDVEALKAQGLQVREVE